MSGTKNTVQLPPPLTDAEQIELLKQVVENGELPPGGPIIGPPSAGINYPPELLRGGQLISPQAARNKRRAAAHPLDEEEDAWADADEEDGIFDPDDEEEGLDPRRPPSHKLKLPNGKWLYVHACSPEDAKRVTNRAVAGVVKLHITDETKRAVELDIQQKVLQTLCVCRRGPYNDSPLMFGDKHISMLRKGPWWETCQQVVSISNRLGVGQLGLSEAVRVFFQGTGSLFSTCAWRWSSEPKESERWQTALEVFGSYVSVWSMAGSVDMEQVQAALLEIHSLVPEPLTPIPSIEELAQRPALVRAAEAAEQAAGVR